MKSSIKSEPFRKIPRLCIHGHNRSREIVFGSLVLVTFRDLSVFTGQPGILITPLFTSQRFPLQVLQRTSQQPWQLWGHVSHRMQMITTMSSCGLIVWRRWSSATDILGTLCYRTRPPLTYGTSYSSCRPHIVFVLFRSAKEVTLVGGGFVVSGLVWLFQ